MASQALVELQVYLASVVSAASVADQDSVVIQVILA